MTYKSVETVLVTKFLRISKTCVFLRHPAHVCKQNKLANECHSSIGLRKSKKFVEFFENEKCYGLAEFNKC